MSYCKCWPIITAAIFIMACEKNGPSIGDAIQILNECSDLTANDIGLETATFNYSQAIAACKKDINNPHCQSYFAETYIYDSDLEFDRSKVDRERYFQIKDACAKLADDLEIGEIPD